MTDKNKPVLTGHPNAMCSYKNKLYLFFDKAYQVLDFKDGKPISSSSLAAWEKPNSCVAQDDYIWISATNGLFTLHFDGGRHKILHADTQGWDNVHALGIYKDNLYAVCDVIKQYDTSSGIISTVDKGDWSHMACGAQCGNFLYLPSKRGPLWVYNMEKNSYEQISHQWNASKAAVFIEDQLLILADEGIWLVDCESKKKRLVKKEDCSDVACCTSLGRDIYVVKKAGTFWRYTMDILETNISLEWTIKDVPQETKADSKSTPNLSAPQGMQTAIISWNANNANHFRLYRVENGKVVEYCKDGDSNWQKGGFPEITGNKVSAVNWDNHIRVYVQNENSVQEMAYENGWNHGGFKATGNLLGARLFSDCKPEVWIEDKGSITEWMWLGSWSAYHEGSISQ